MSCFPVLMEVMRERVAQQDKWGEQNHPWLVEGHHWENFNNADQARDMVNTLDAPPPTATRLRRHPHRGVPRSPRG